MKTLYFLSYTNILGLKVPLRAFDTYKDAMDFNEQLNKTYDPLGRAHFVNIEMVDYQESDK